MIDPRVARVGVAVRVAGTRRAWTARAALAIAPEQVAPAAPVAQVAIESEAETSRALVRPIGLHRATAVGARVVSVVDRVDSVAARVASTVRVPEAAVHVGHRAWAAEAVAADEEEEEGDDDECSNFSHCRLGRRHGNARHSRWVR